LSAHRFAYAALLLAGACARVANVLDAPQIPDAGTQSAGGTAGAAGAIDAGEAGTGPAPGDVGTSTLAAGIGHSCVTVRGAMYCWGDNTSGELGVGDNVSRNAPTRVGTRGDWQAVAAGASHSCALRSDASVYCFGANSIGQLGVATITGSAVPVATSIIGPVRELATEVNHVCAIGTDGSLQCWGENFEGEIGQNDPPPFVSQYLPTQIGTDHDWLAVSTGQGDTCGIRGSNALYGWGRNSSAQLGLGDGAPIQFRTPTKIGVTTYVQVKAGQDHTCAIRTDGGLECWGLNDSGSLGTGDRTAHSSAIQIGSKLDWRELSLNVFHTCAIDSAQHLFCWGRNVEGQLGTGTNDDQLSPALIDGENYVQVAVGRFHTCAMKADDSIYCTGANDAGQLGVRDNERRNALTRVQLP